MKPRKIKELLFGIQTNPFSSFHNERLEMSVRSFDKHCFVSWQRIQALFRLSTKNFLSASNQVKGRNNFYLISRLFSFCGAVILNIPHKSQINKTNFVSFPLLAEFMQKNHNEAQDSGKKDDGWLVECQDGRKIHQEAKRTAEKS